MIEVDGTERLQELADTLESREVQIELTRCPHFEAIKSVYAEAIDFEAVNVAIEEECRYCALDFYHDRLADWQRGERLAS